MPDGDGGIAELPVQENSLAGTHEQFFTAFSHMLIATRSSGDWNSEYEQGLLQMMMNEHGVTCFEAYKAFMYAYGDRFTPSSGIEWRHLWNYIEEMRKGRDRQYYSYREMLNIVDKENLTTDHFERNEQEVERVKEQNPNISVEEMRVWKRK